MEKKTGVWAWHPSEVSFRESRGIIGLWKVWRSKSWEDWGSISLWSSEELPAPWWHESRHARWHGAAEGLRELPKCPASQNDKILPESQKAGRELRALFFMHIWASVYGKRGREHTEVFGIWECSEYGGIKNSRVDGYEKCLGARNWVSLASSERVE